MKKTASFAILCLLSGGTALAAQRASANYSIHTDTVDAAGSRATSANYSNTGSASLIAGVSTIAAPAETAKGGYIGQLYDVSGLLVNSAAPDVNETGTLQLAAWQLLDDATFLATDPNAVTWSVVSGPITGVSASGLATAGPVFQNTSANVQGTFAGFTGSRNFTVLDSIPDNFGGYAGDGIGDDWQVQYFGLPPNPAAGPLMDSDGDGQNNRLEWIAGLNPTDAGSVFKLRIARIAGNVNVIFGPTVAGRTYTVKYGFNFLDVPHWLTLPGGIVAGSGGELFVTDTNAVLASPKKYYRVEITKP